MASKVILMLLVIQMTQNRARTISMAQSKANVAKVRVWVRFMRMTSLS